MGGVILVRESCLGSWRPASLTTGDIVTVKVCMGVAALIRASDYATPNRRVPTSTIGIENTLPYAFWAALFAAVGVILLTGMASRRHGMVWFGHALGFAAYSTLAFAVAQFAFTIEPWDDWKRISPLAILALLHFLLALRSGPRPIPRDHHERTTERHMGPAA